MKIRFLISTVLLIFTLGITLEAQNNGEELYKASCLACHTINKGRLVGPDLSGIYEQQDQDWLIRFIRSSQKMVKEGDSRAVAIFQEYSQIPMPDNDLTDEQILSILDYIRETDSGQSGEKITQTDQTTVTDSTIAVAFTTDMVKEGKALFYGRKNFSNGTTSCIACHIIRDGSLISGGKLSVDLTGSYSKLGAAGIGAILSNPPFPSMKVALKGTPLTDDEIQSITALLQFTDRHFSQNPPPAASSGLVFAVLAFTFALFILVFIYIIYDNRKIPS